MSSNYLMKKAPFLLISVVLMLLPVSCLDLDQEDSYQEMLEQERIELAAYMEEHYPGVEPLPSGLYYVELEAGTGDSAKVGNNVIVDYAGYFLNGTMFDTSMDSAAIRGEIYQASRIYNPLEFTLGYANLIYGFQEGVSMMREGGAAKVFFPSNLGYGRGSGSIPTNSTLIFDLYLLEVSEF
ncbi:MAG TPA: FKBP-type peptidyl-prolyl cis-trans isomerase [Bacteroidetes bacterium]|nr:FKBP-type peptidyl-prolyl cis-trans isomerase [Bacteroidota bacterium]